MNLQQWLLLERGRVASLAAHLKVPQSFVSRMASGDKDVPLAHCPEIQAFTGGCVTCEELRPDMVQYFALIRQQGLAVSVQAPANNLGHVEGAA